MLIPFYMLGNNLSMMKLMVFMESQTIPAFFDTIMKVVFSFLPYTVERSRKRRICTLGMNNALGTLLIAHLCACLWIRVNGYRTDHPLSDYINALYFLYSTASTIGYGDITVNRGEDGYSEYRYVFAIFLMMLALCYFAYIQSVIFKVLFEWKKTSVALENELTELEDWMAVRNRSAHGNITWRVEKTIKHFIDYLSRCDLHTTIHQHGFLLKSGHDVQACIEDHVTCNVVERYSFFNDLPPEVCQQLVLGYKPLK